MNTKILKLPLLIIPLLASLIYYDYQRFHLAAIIYFRLVILAFFLWSFMEYSIQRWGTGELFYATSSNKSKTLIHSVVLQCFIFSALWAITPTPYYFTFVSFYIFALLISEFIFVQVVKEPTVDNIYINYLRDSHNKYLRSTHSCQYGITSPFWDYIFGTVDSKMLNKKN